MLSNEVKKENLFSREIHYCYINKLPKVIDTLCYVKDYNVEHFTSKNKIKISWEKQKKGI